MTKKIGLIAIDKYCDNAIEFAKTIEPDIKISWGINWIWAYGFKTSEDATKFDNLHLMVAKSKQK